jgi:hypothetical protein
MPPITIRLKKKRDGASALSLTRADGSATWQRNEGATGAFFPLHDLRHYAVETTLALREAFYGLLADGWDLSDFGTPWPRGHLPYEAMLAESLVGLLERAGWEGGDDGAAQVNEALASTLARGGVAHVRPVTAAELAAMDARFAELAARWRSLPPGEAMELPFP